MTLNEVTSWLTKYLRHDEWSGKDRSLNGLQVSCKKAQVARVAFAVDACLQSFQKAVVDGADLLVVHHGLFWGQPLAVTGGHYQRLKTLLDADLALFASHLPLDAHPVCGNNAVIAQVLGLEDLVPFGTYHGAKIGYAGRLGAPLTLDRVCEILLGGREQALQILPFGKPKVSTVGIVSGGATSEIREAIVEGLDLYITGDADHTIYHEALEAGINMISGGHYATETWGVRRLAEVMALETGLSTVFLDSPTGL